MLVVIGTDCIGSSKSNYHTIMTTTALFGDCRLIINHKATEQAYTTSLTTENRPSLLCVTLFIDKTEISKVQINYVPLRKLEQLGLSFLYISQHSVVMDGFYITNISEEIGDIPCYI